MAQTFANAPLVEIIVDLRWEANAAIAGVGAQGLPIKLVDGGADEFMMRFGGVAYALGFERSERLVPAGFPVPMGTPIYRYRPAEKPKQELMQSALLQIGAGVFSANAVPPYKSWDEFSPTVRAGIGALLQARHESDKQLPFTQVSLRYVDAFRGDHLGTKSIQSFIRDVLGFKTELPSALQKHLRPEAETQTNLQFKLPLPDGMTLAVGVGAGLFNGETVVLMHMQAAADEPVAPDLEALMMTLGKARQVIHNSFVEMTATIHGTMKPQGG
jgi:uncharacterized protein (TIGR04255 family)